MKLTHANDSIKAALKEFYLKNNISKLSYKQAISQFRNKNLQYRSLSDQKLEGLLFIVKSEIKSANVNYPSFIRNHIIDFCTGKRDNEEDLQKAYLEHCQSLADGDIYSMLAVPAFQKNVFRDWLKKSFSKSDFQGTWQPKNKK